MVIETLSKICHIKVSQKGSYLYYKSHGSDNFTLNGTLMMTWSNLGYFLYPDFIYWLIKWITLV